MPIGDGNGRKRGDVIARSPFAWAGFLPDSASGLSDEALWEAIDQGKDVLCGMDFATAVRIDPRRVEGLVLQRIQVVRNRLLDLRRSPPESGAQYVARNRALWMTRGTIGAEAIAKSLEDNWRMAAREFDGMALAARSGHPFAAVVLRRLATGWSDLERGFHEGIAVAVRAACLEESGLNQDAWRRVAACIDDMRRHFESMLALAAPRGN